MKKPNTYLLHEGTLASGDAFIVTATLKSKNEKTGNMVQIAIMLRDVDPVAGVLSGLDAVTICTDCPFATGNGCYVNVAKSPLTIWRAFHRGNVPFLAPKDYARVFSGRKVRFGSYGNPTLIPISIVKAICAICEGWTGYFHNWKSMTPQLARRWNAYFMASTETKDSLAMANQLRLRTFHASPVQPEGTVECLSDTHNKECKDCMLCCGTKLNAKSVWINPHGVKVKKANQVAMG